MCDILGKGCAFFPDASIDKQLGMIALPVGDRSVGNERAGFRSGRAFVPIVGYLMPREVPSAESRRYSALERWSEANRTASVKREEFTAITN